MNVQSVGSVAFSAKTRDGNDYQESNTGRAVGTLAGVAYGGYGIYGANKNTKEIGEFLSTDAGKKALASQNMEELKKAIKESNLSAKIKKREIFALNMSDNLLNKIQPGSSDSFAKDFAEGLKVAGKPNPQMTMLKVGNLIILTLLGLGIGAIVDKNINSGRRIQADVNAAEAKKNKKTEK